MWIEEINENFVQVQLQWFLKKWGGKVIYFGKPYPEVYNQSINNKNKKILSIGDNLNTDIKGANLLNYDSFIISNGIHKNEINEKWN